MKKIYYDYVYTPKNEKDNNYLLDLTKACLEASEKLSQETLNILIPELFQHLREKMGLSDKVLGFGANKDATKAFIATFPKEPDGKYYQVYQDEVNNKPYILVEE